MEGQEAGTDSLEEGRRSNVFLLSGRMMGVDSAHHTEQRSGMSVGCIPSTNSAAEAPPQPPTATLPAASPYIFIIPFLRPICPPPYQYI